MLVCGYASKKEIKHFILLFVLKVYEENNIIEIEDS